MILSIDFDGTIVRGEYPAIDGLQPYAKQYINQLHADGHYIIINTCREGQQLLDAINYLLTAGIRFDRVNDNAAHNITQYNNNSRKIFADVYIDDKQVGGLPMWGDIYQLLKN